MRNQAHLKGAETVLKVCENGIARGADGWVVDKPSTAVRWIEPLIDMRQDVLKITTTEDICDHRHHIFESGRYTVYESLDGDGMPIIRDRVVVVAPKKVGDDLLLVRESRIYSRVLTKLGEEGLFTVTDPRSNIRFEILGTLV